MDSVSTGGGGANLDKALVLTDTSATVANMVELFGGNEKDPAATPQKNAHKKKLKGVDGEAVESGTSTEVTAGSATPLEGDHRKQ